VTLRGVKQETDIFRSLQSTPVLNYYHDDKVVTALVGALLTLSLPSIACQQAAHYRTSSPRETLESVQRAQSKQDVKGFENLLSKRTLDWLQSEANRTQTSVDSLIRSYLERHNDVVAIPVQREERLDDTTIVVRGNGDRFLGRFVQEGTEWKLDGFGSSMQRSEPD
jgi:hypothetical protein